MPILTPQFLFDFESNMQTITENEYAKFSANMHWSKFMKVRPSASRRELVAWLISTAQIEDLEAQGGKMVFEDIVSKYTEYTNRFAGAGLKLKKSQLEDLDGNGLDAATKWSGDIGAYMAYWPQKQFVSLLKNGETGTTYDGKAFFATDHPVNPGDANNAVTFSNLKAHATNYKIDDSVSVEVALTNLSKAVAEIKAIKMPNGEDPRFLRPTGIVCGPRMQQRVAQLTNAKFIAQAASSGGGSGDVEKLIASFGFGEPTVLDELSGFENDTTWFLACEELGSSQLGAFVYIDREPFKITYYTGAGGGGNGVDANLDRMNELEWHCQGRNGIGYGHPFLFFKHVVR